MQLGIVDVSHLRDDLTKLSGIAFDEVCVAGFVPRPSGPRRRTQAHMRVHRWWLQLAHTEGPVKRMDAQHRDVLEAIGLHALQPKQVVDRLAVRPSLHEPCGDI